MFIGQGNRMRQEINFSSKILDGPQECAISPRYSDYHFSDISLDERIFIDYWEISVFQTSWIRDNNRKSMSHVVLSRVNCIWPPHFMESMKVLSRTVRFISLYHRIGFLRIWIASSLSKIKRSVAKKTKNIEKHSYTHILVKKKS